MSTPTASFKLWKAAASRPDPDGQATMNTACSSGRCSRWRPAPGIASGLFCLMLSAPPHQAADAPSPIQFQNVTQQTGITFVHTDGGSGQRYIVESVASGLATFDYNGDGKIDILFLNGAPLPGSPARTPPPRNGLYRNDGGWRF